MRISLGEEGEEGEGQEKEREASRKRTRRIARIRIQEDVSRFPDSEEMPPL
jgi:hypothetical protein